MMARVQILYKHAIMLCICTMPILFIANDIFLQFQFLTLVLGPNNLLTISLTKRQTNKQAND
jgi:hypothetical protein